MYKDSGITLIALVVTIVVLLILSAVSINAILGENGVMRSAQKAESSWKKAGEHDEEEIEKVSDYLTVVEVNQYVNKRQSEDGTAINGKKLVLVYTDLKDVWYTYKGKNMFDISDSGYTYKGLGYKKVFGIFIDSDEEFSKSYVKKVDANELSNGIKVDYSGDKYDVNRSGTVDIKDVTATVAVYNCNELYFENSDLALGINNCFRADVNRDKKVDEEDFELVRKICIDLGNELEDSNLETNN